MDNVSNTSDDFYYKVRNTGFIYGHIVVIDTISPISIKDWFKSEISKVALLNTLYKVYYLTKNEREPSPFILRVVDFYNQMNPQEFNLFEKILPKNTPTLTLEKIIDERVQTNENIVSKNFSHLVTNALLFIDVLAFHQYLINGSIPEKYLKKIEETVVNVVTLALKTKSNKSQHDDLLIKLLKHPFGTVNFRKFQLIV